jgi:hypothetical protein
MDSYHEALLRGPEIDRPAHPGEWHGPPFLTVMFFLLLFDSYQIRASSAPAGSSREGFFGVFIDM